MSQSHPIIVLLDKYYSNFADPCRILKDTFEDLGMRLFCVFKSAVSSRISVNNAVMRQS